MNKLGTLLFVTISLQIAPVLADGINTPEVSADSNTTKEASSATKSDRSKPDRAVWDSWHKALAKELYDRIGSMLQKIGPPENERKFYCKLRWRIYRHGRVIPMSIEGTDSQLFRDIVRKGVDSLHSSELIKFPEGTSKEYVEKISTFYYGWRPTKQFEGIGDFDSTLDNPMPRDKAE